MTGIEKIIKKIEDDCKINCEEIISKAQAQAEAILRDAQNEGKKAEEEALKSANEKCRINIELAESRAEHEHKKAVLETKIDIINEVIKESMQKLKNLPDDDYFKTVTQLVGHYAETGRGRLYFSKEDLKRMPGNFESSLNRMLEDSGRSVVISDETVPVDGGFIISYEDIEQNCSFDSLLDASLDEIKDEIYEAMFLRNGV